MFSLGQKVKVAKMNRIGYVCSIGKDRNGVDFIGVVDNFGRCRVDYFAKDCNAA